MIATINKEYALRFLGVALLFLAFTGWFLYDGIIGYPQENARVKPVAEALAKQGLTAEDWMNTIKTGTSPLVEGFRAAGMNAPAKISDTYGSWMNTQDPRARDKEAATAVLLQPIHSENDILAQFVSAGIGLFAALLLIVIVSIRYLTRYTLEKDVLTVSFGRSSTAYPLHTLTELDDTQWKTRGILKVHFQHRIVTLDAWHHSGVKAIAEALLPKESTEA